MNGNPTRWIHSGIFLSLFRAVAADKKQTQLNMMYIQDCGRSINCGGLRFALSSGVTDIASMQPTITYAMGTHSFCFGFSNKITRVTAKLIMIDMLPKIPTLAGGRKVRARKSNVDAAAERTSAMIKSGRQYRGEVKCLSRLIRFVRGSLYSVWLAANF